MFESVLQRLSSFAQEFSLRGKQIYLVGGAVRNLLLGREAQDFDFTTDALPTEVQSYFRKVLPTGLQHGTVTVLFQGESYEVTTFRIDGDYGDGRRPDQVQFTPSLEEDLKRRDFTINAIALDLSTGQLVDPHDGQGDLRRKLLRAIGDPGSRFDEDALRLLRLYRFAAQLGFSIDPETSSAVAPRRHKLAKVSRERIREELDKAMASAHPELALWPLQELGILSDLFRPLPVLSLPASSLDHLGRAPAVLRWSLWLTVACGLDHDAWERRLKELTFSNADCEAALGPARAWSCLAAFPPETAAKAVVEAWGDRARVPLGLQYLEWLKQEGFWKDEGEVCAQIRRVSLSKEPIFLKELALGGRDLLEAGVAPGPTVGKTLTRLQRLVWAHPELNSAAALKEQLLTLR